MAVFLYPRPGLAGLYVAEPSSGKFAKVGLTPKERLFLKYYLKTFNATKAYQALAKASGSDITKDSAITLGARLLGRVKKKSSGKKYSMLRDLGMTALSSSSMSDFAQKRPNFIKARLSLTALIMALVCGQLSFSLSSGAERKSSSITQATFTHRALLSTYLTMGEAVSKDLAMQIIKPQPGPQEQFLSSPADIAIYGGSAGGGKSFALLMEPLRHINNPLFGAVYFRRTMPMITAEGGAWDNAQELYPPLGGRCISSPQNITRFPSGARIGFHHLQYEDSIHDYQSAQIPLILFDELTQFTKRQFFYMLSRNRSTSGIHGYVRAGTNPDPDSWVRDFISWWIDDDTGLPLPERSGILRWFIRLDDQIVWADTEEDILATYGAEADPLSVTFIPSSVYDNKALLSKDPGYLSKLKALPRWEREQLLNGNWNARASAGMIFARSDFKIVDAAPPMETVIRYWDRAATEQTENSPDPDWTAGVKIGRGTDGLFYILDVERFRERPFGVKRRVANTASRDGFRCSIGIEQDPGSAGISEADDFILALAGYNVRAYPVSQAKVVRWKPLSSQAQAGNVMLLRGGWNDDFIAELAALTDNPKQYGHDDQADAAAGGFNAIASTPVVDETLARAIAARRS